MRNAGGGMPSLERKGWGLIVLSGATIQTWRHLNVCPKAPRSPSCDTWMMVSFTMGTKLWN